MAAALSGVSLSAAVLMAGKAAEPQRHQHQPSSPLALVPRRMVAFRPLRSAPTPPGISEKVSESIKAAEEACAEGTDSGECAAAWDEVEELSAAASHARDKLKDADPLEAYCKDNPETDECRTYDD